MWKKLREISAWLVPAFALGLYSGRLISEMWGLALGINVTGAVLLTAVTTFLALLIVKGHHIRSTWPLLILYVYVFYPDPYPAAAIVTGLVTAVCLAQGAARRRQIKPTLSAKYPWHLPILAGSLTVGFLALYTHTLAPGLLAADNGEFQLVAANLGVAHPPGFPLYTLAAHVLTRIPLGDSAAWRVNLFSVLTSTATLFLVYLTVYRLAPRHLAAVTAVLALGTATTFWAQATSANIRSLTALLATLAVFALVQFYHAVRENGRRPANDRWLILFAFALSAGVSHHLSLAFMGIVFVLFVLLVDPSLVKMPRRWLRPFLAALLGLLPLLYLPLRATSGARGAKESLATLDGFLNHFLGLGFQGDFFYFVQPLILWERLKVMFNVMTFQFADWLLLGMVVGLLLMVWRERKLAFLLGLSFGVHTLITAMYRAPQTVEYMLPAYIPAVLCLGYASGHIDEVATAVAGQGERWLQPMGQLISATLFVAALFQGWQHYPSYRQLHLAEDARDYAQALLLDAPADSTILANWHWVTPLWYLQEVEGLRPDVSVRYVAPGGRPYAETWAAEIRAEMANGRDVIATWFDEAAYQKLPPAEPIHEAFWFRQQPRADLPPFFKPLPLTLGEGIQLLALQLNRPEIEVWQETILTIAWQPISNLQSPISLSAHLIGSDGRSFAQSDQTIKPQAEGVTLTQFRLTPRPGTPPGSYTIHLISEEHNEPISSVFLLPMSQPPFSQNPMQRLTADDGGQIIGYDWDNSIAGQPRLYLHAKTADGYLTAVHDSSQVEISATGPWGIPNNQWQPPQDHSQIYVPFADGIIWTGDQISNLQSPISNLPQTFTTSHSLQRDYVVSVRLVGYEADGFHWAWCDLVDYVPAMGAIPTLKWIRGSVVTSPHQIVYTNDPVAYDAYCQSAKPAPGAPVLAVAETAVPGQTVGGTLVIYDAFSKRPLPILDERLSDQFPWIPLGEAILGERP